MLTFHSFVLGVALPLVCQAFTQRSLLPQPPQPRAAPQRRPAGWLRVVAAVQRAWRSADTALFELCTGEGYEGLHLALFACLALGLVWAVAAAPSVLEPAAVVA